MLHIDRVKVLFQVRRGTRSLLKKLVLDLKRLRFPELVRYACLSGTYWTGIGGAYAKLVHPLGAVVLMYHSIATPVEADWIDPANSLPLTVFEWQMRFLSRHRRVLSMSELVTKLERNDVIDPGTVAITFDDGYLDNLRNAAPVLRKYSLPATLYVPTGLIDRAEAQWVDRLYVLLRTRTADEIEVPEVGKCDLADPRQLANLKGKLTARLRIAGPEAREALLRLLRACLRSSAEPPRLTMNWDEVREWSRFPGLDIGVHTAEHVDLSSCVKELAEAEIRMCVARAAETLGRAPEHFSFPYGRSTSDTRAMVRAAGLRSAVAGGPDPRVRRGSPVDRIPRVAAPTSVTLFRVVTSPAYPDLPLRLIGRA